MALCKSASRYDPEKNFLAWAFKIARFQVLAFLKKQKRSRLVFDDELLPQLADDAEEESAHFDDMRKALNICLRKLPNRHRALVEARYEDGATIDNVAKASAQCRRRYLLYLESVPLFGIVSNAK